MDTKDIFSYTNRDYESTRQEAISKIPYLSRGDWTDTNPTDPGVIIIDLVYALVDMMQYYMDHQALEAYLSTAKERKNLFKLAEQLGYKIRSAKGAEVEAVFTTQKSYDSLYVIPQYTQLRAGKQAIPYLTLEDLVVPAGVIRARVRCVQGVYHTDVYEGTGRSNLDGDANSSNQVVELENLGVDTDSVTVTSTTGEVWQRVDNITLVKGPQRAFQAKLMHDGKVLVLFGNGERGAAPQEGDKLLINYIASLGSEGAIAAGELNKIEADGLYTTKGERVTDIAVTNNSNSVGGTDPESSSMIRDLAPSVIKSQDRAVTLSDYEYLARRVPGVRDAKAYDINNYPEACLYYEVKLVILPEDDKADLEILKSNTYDYLYKRCNPPTFLSVLTPEVKTIDIEISLVSDPSYTDTSIRLAINDKLKEYFSDLGHALGEPMKAQLISSLVAKVPGVYYIESINPREDIEVNPLELIKIGQVDIKIAPRRV